MERIKRWAGVVLMLPVLLTTVFAQPAQAEAAGNAVIIKGLPSVQQWYNLSCEYAAAAAVTLYWGNLVSQKTFLREVPSSPNPHIGFRGDINGPFGGINDYGVYAEPLATVLENRGYNATVYYNDLGSLKSNIDAGNPAVVWLTVGQNEDRPAYYHELDGQRFKLVPGEHAVVAYGYDDTGIYLMDVSDGGFYHTSWDSFLRRWGYFDDMTLVITPQ
jgi:uncharacterized protein YvpB